MREGEPVGCKGHVLLIVENAPVPLDARVWPEAQILTAAGYDVTVISPATHGFTKSDEEIDGIRVLRHPMPRSTESLRGYIAEYVVALWHELRLTHRVCREVGCDVVHVSNPPDVLFLAAAWAKLMTDASVIFDQHDLSSELFAAKFGKRGLVYRALRLLERLSYGFADVVVATNESYRRVAIARGRKSADDVFVVRNAPWSTPAVPSQPDESLRAGRAFLVGYVGWMAEQDGVDVLLDVVEYVVHERRRADVQFLLIGDGPVRDMRMADARWRGLEEYMTWPGFIRGERLEQMIDTVDVYLCPEPKNSYNDVSTMIKVVEAMAHGKAVVQFDLLEGRRTAGSAAIYARDSEPEALGDCLLEVLDDSGMRTEMAAEGRRRFKESLSWNTQGERLLSAYRRAFAVRESRGRQR